MPAIRVRPDFLEELEEEMVINYNIENAHYNHNNSLIEIWVGADFKPHRENNPAVIQGNRHGWFINGQLHRNGNLPAMHDSDTGEYIYVIDGFYHRKDGPAYKIEGVEEWYLYGEYHRIDGPAIIGSDGALEWYANGRSFYDDINDYIKFLRKFDDIDDAGEVALRLKYT